MLRATKADSPRRSKRQYLEGTRPELVNAAWQFWWALQDLNLGPTDYESAALTSELRARIRLQNIECKVQNGRGKILLSAFCILHLQQSVSPQLSQLIMRRVIDGQHFLRRDRRD